ncbi:head-closure protein [Vibrio phage 1.264.O._10N.286.51.F2]|nr:head-closure protein [Vibrio phage 1.264.O._10N.286.51.F2]
MSRALQQLNYSSFTGGLITEASPLTFPDGASIEENNFELTKQGFRRRRLGMDAVSSEAKLENRVNNPSEITTFLWDNNGNTGQELLVVGMRNEILIYDVTDYVPGERLVYQSTVAGERKLNLTSHAGQLIIANGQKELTVISALGNNVFSERKESLMIRDRVGIPDYSRDIDTDRKVSLLNAAKAGYRPTGNELYLATPYPIFPETDPIIVTPPITALYDFTGKREISRDVFNGTTTVRNTLTSSVEFNEYQGYPIESFILTSKTGNTTEYSLSVIFKEGYYRTDIASVDLNSGNLALVSGTEYLTILTEVEYNEFFNLTRTLRLEEENHENHPHIYNLWNQGWGESRMTYDNGTGLLRPIDSYHQNTLTLPANADNINSVLYPNNQHDSNRTADRFHPVDLEANPQGSSVSPQGHYIIDALDRGQTRADIFRKDLEDKDEDSRVADAHMSFEKTTGGCTTVAEYAGRVWYAGFSGDTTGSTLRMSSKILYSQTDNDNLTSCYQEADPTSKSDSALVDTDGGWVSIDAIDEVVKLVPTDTALVVFATNGVWAIAGIDGNTFAPTSSMVIKVTDKGPLNAENIIQVDADIFFWAKDGLYQLQSAGFASFNLLPMTKATINTLVLDLNGEDFLGMSGAYDERRDRLVWIIDGDGGVSERRELVFHLAFQSFTVNTYYKGNGVTGSKEVVSVVKTPQFVSTLINDNVVEGLDNIIEGADNIIVDGSERDGKPSRIAYLSLREASDATYVFFSDLVRDDFTDWGLVDAPAHLLTGYVTGGDTSRQKQVPSLTVHCNRTETEATEEGVMNESSCLVQSQWEWTNDPFANKWSPVIQAYRLPRPQIRGIGQPVAEGIEVVTTRNKLRGRGRTVSLLFSTEAEKDCQLLGWSMIASANGLV